MSIKHTLGYEITWKIHNLCEEIKLDRYYNKMYVDVQSNRWLPLLDSRGDIILEKDPAQMKRGPPSAPVCSIISWAYSVHDLHNKGWFTPRFILLEVGTIITLWSCLCWPARERDDDWWVNWSSIYCMWTKVQLTASLSMISETF